MSGSEEKLSQLLERISGSRRLKQLIGEQRIVRNDSAIIDAIEKLLKHDESLLAAYAAGDELIKQGESGQNRLLLLLTGRVALYRNDNCLAEVHAGESLGEFPILDPALTHKVTVKALDDMVVAFIPEDKFFEIAEDHPKIWMNMSRLLARRLRTTGELFWPPNEKPRVFVGSSAEGLDIARAIQAGLSYDPILTKLWTDNVFLASKTTIEDLMNEIQYADFAVLIATPDDRIESRGGVKQTPRDNVLFELGLFMGRLGRGRTFLVKQRDLDLRLPTDLLGVTTLGYALGTDEEVESCMGPVVNKIRQRIRKLGSLQAVEVLGQRNR